MGRPPAAHRAPVQPGTRRRPRPSPRPSQPGPSPDAEGEGAESTAASTGPGAGRLSESLYRAAGVKRSGRVDTCSAVPLGNACAWAFGIASERAICGVMSSTISVRVVVSLLFENSRPSSGIFPAGNVRAGFLRAVLDQAGQHLGFPFVQPQHGVRIARADLVSQQARGRRADLLDDIADFQCHLDRHVVVDVDFRLDIELQADIR